PWNQRYVKGSSPWTSTWNIAGAPEQTAVDDGWRCMVTAVHDTPTKPAGSSGGTIGVWSRLTQPRLGDQAYPRKGCAGTASRAGWGGLARAPPSKFTQPVLGLHAKPCRLFEPSRLTP